MRRKILHPYGQSGSNMRIVSLLMALAVLWMLYDRLKDPAMWRVLADEKEPRNVRVEPKPEAVATEIITPGPNDLDPEEFEAAEENFDLLVDKAPRMSRDYEAYWRLMKWSRTQSMAEMEKRSRDDIRFAQFWDTPEKYRGKLIYLRMHLLRVVKHDASKDNPLNLETVYEAWGGTDESRSNPICVTIADPPPGLPVGDNIRAEVVVAGYFLKWISFRAFAANQAGGQKTIAAPEFIGRMRLLSVPKPPPEPKIDYGMMGVVFLAGVGIVLYTLWFATRKRTKSKIKMLPKDLPTVGSVEEPNFDSMLSSIVTGTPHETGGGLHFDALAIPAVGAATAVLEPKATPTSPEAALSAEPAVPDDSGPDAEHKSSS